MKHKMANIREAIMRLSMCARNECEICQYKDRPKAELPSEDCKARATKNMNILADVCLRDEISKLHEEVLNGKTVNIKFDDELIERLIQRYIELTKDKGAKRFGKWLFKRRYYEADECNCSLCGQLMTTQTGTRMNFCPNCGADMKCLEGGEQR